MSAKELKMLGDAYAREVEAALSRGIDIYQTKSKLAEVLVEKGALQRAETVLGGRFPVTIKGYRLTHAGRFLYCSTSCQKDESP